METIISTNMEKGKLPIKMWNIEYLTEGLYLIRLKTSAETKTCKVVLLK